MASYFLSGNGCCQTESFYVVTESQSLFKICDHSRNYQAHVQERSPQKPAHIFQAKEILQQMKNSLNSISQARLWDPREP